jgi:hypothetical protein
LWCLSRLRENIFDSRKTFPMISAKNLDFMMLAYHVF